MFFTLPALCRGRRRDEEIPGEIEGRDGMTYSCDGDFLFPSVLLMTAGVDLGVTTVTVCCGRPSISDVAYRCASLSRHLCNRAYLCEEGKRNRRSVGSALGDCHDDG